MQTPRIADVQRLPVSARLVDADESVLLVVDVQEGFVAQLEDEQRDGLIDRISFVIESAKWAGVPVLATLETPEELGGWHPELEHRHPDTPILDKQVFGLADDPAVFAAVKDTGRQTVVLVGLQTDVCIAHSALSLLSNGFEVVCLADCVASPGAPHGFGLDRMRAANVPMLCARQLHYEWIRTVAAYKRFVEAHPALPV
jgi:nicotinamidase-related amidase